MPHSMDGFIVPRVGRVEAAAINGVFLWVLTLSLK